MFTVFLAVAQLDAWWPGLILLGFLIGIISGLFGIGGGFLLTPCLRIIFNIPYPIAIGSGLLQILSTSVLSACKHWQQKNLDFKMGTITAAGSLLGTECGVRLLRVIVATGAVNIGNHSFDFSDLVINISFLVLLSIVAGFMSYEVRQNEQSGLDEPKTKLGEIIRRCTLPPLVSFHQSGILALSLWVPVGMSFFVGCLTGLLGIGGGFIAFPLFVYILGVPTKIAVGTSTIQVFLASGYGTFRHIQDGHVDLLLVLCMFLGSIPGVHLGVKLAGKINSCSTRIYFSRLVVLAILFILFDMLRQMLA